MSKTKMRCTACGKWFQSANAKDTTCPDCVQKARKEKLAAKNAPPIAAKTAGPGGQNTASPLRPPPPPKPKPVQSGTNQWLDKLEDVKIAEPEQPQARPRIPLAPVQRDTYNNGNGQNGFRGPAPTRPNTAYRERDERGPNSRGPAPYHVSGSVGANPSIVPRPQYPRQPIEGRPPGGYNKPVGRPGPRPGGPGAPQNAPKPKVKKPAAPPKPKREKIPPPPPFTPTPEQITKVEERYLELAHPTEFDGIRTQIAQEESIPKKTVKQIIKELRSRQNIPSWWELQTYKGTTEELEKIKAVYEPYLPVPPVGVHKLIADTLELKPGTIYQAIKTIRQELSLPQYNDPTYHEIELARLAQKRQKRPSSQPETPATSETISASEEPVATPPIEDAPSTEQTDNTGINTITSDQEPQLS